MVARPRLDVLPYLLSGTAGTVRDIREQAIEAHADLRLRSEDDYALFEYYRSEGHSLSRSRGAPLARFLGNSRATQDVLISNMEYVLTRATNGRGA